MKDQLENKVFKAKLDLRDQLDQLDMKDQQGNRVFKVI